MLLTEKYPVPAEPTTQRHAGAGNTVKIRFVEREGNESDMLNPLQEYPGRVRVQRVERGDPTSSVAKAVQVFLDMGKRTCDRYKKFIPAEECYSMATRAENNNTLFLIPDLGYQKEGQRYDVQRVLATGAGQGRSVACRCKSVVGGFLPYNNKYKKSNTIIEFAK
jgi:hypothetical protein